MCIRDSCVGFMESWWYSVWLVFNCSDCLAVFLAFFISTLLFDIFKLELIGTHSKGRHKSPAQNVFIIAHRVTITVIKVFFLDIIQGEPIRTNRHTFQRKTLLTNTKWPALQIPCSSSQHSLRLLCMAAASLDLLHQNLCFGKT